MPDDVHPQIQVLLDKAAELGIPKIQDMSTEAARAFYEQMSAARVESYPPPAVASVENASTGAGYGHVPVRIYRAGSGTEQPVVVFYHGGGHVFGSLDTHDTFARYMALGAGCTLVAVDYRMGPEHPFPAAPGDAFDAARWVADNAQRLGVDPTRLALAGDSAGGNLSAVVSLMARESAAFGISAQVLIYPVIDYRGGTDSFSKFGEGYGGLEADTVSWFRERYLPDAAHHDDWRACPRLAPGHADLPPALVQVAACDVLRDEGVAYAGQLRAAGTPVELTEYDGMIHGFASYLGLVDDAERAHAEVAGFLKNAWS